MFDRERPCPPVGSLPRRAGGIPSCHRQSGVTTHRMADDRYSVARETSPQNRVREGRIDGQPDVAGAVLQIDGRPTQTVVSAMVARMLQQRDDKARAREVGGEIAVGPGRSTRTVGNEDQRKVVPSDGCALGDWEHERPERLRPLRRLRRVQEANRNQRSLHHISDVDVARANVLIHRPSLPSAGAAGPQSHEPPHLVHESGAPVYCRGGNTRASSR